jgi:glutathione S-transferase
VIGDILGRIEPKDQAYFRASREERFGLSLEQMTERRPEYVQALDTALIPLRVCLRRQSWVAGRAPAYADYSIFGVFQWARVISPEDLLTTEDPVFEWREKMLDQFDGLGRGFAAAI